MREKTPMTEKVKLPDLGHEIIAATQDVFSTMLMLDIDGQDISARRKKEIQSNITSMIGLGGGIRGMLAVHCPAIVAKSITGLFLGMEVEELDDDVKDAIGEIANMVAGNLKIAFADAGVGVELAIPTSVIGESFRVTGIAGATRHNISFQLERGSFVVELLYVLS
jgi:chemotaxis protein CheX